MLHDNPQVISLFKLLKQGGKLQQRDSIIQTTSNDYYLLKT